jgi:hypothetical protein
VAPTITPREFVSLVAVAAQSAFPTADHLTARYPGTASLARRPRQAIRALHQVIAQSPCDAVAHRLLGMAYLHAADFPRAAHHLGRAFDLLRHQGAAPARGVVALSARLEMAALRLLLATCLSTVGLRKLATQILLEGVDP